MPAPDPPAHPESPAEANPGLSEAAPPLVDRGDTLIAAGILGVAAALFYVTTTFDTVADALSQNIGPAYFPRLVLGTIALLALLLPFERHWRGRAISTSSPVAGRTWIAMALLVGLGALLPVAGMLATLFLTCTLLPLVWGRVRVLVVIAFAAAFTLVAWLLFEEVLDVTFEPGLLGDWLR